MTIDQAVRAYLASQATVTAVLGTTARIYCGDVPQTAALPAASVSIVSANHSHTLKGKGDYCLERVQVNCWADTHAAVKSLGEIFRAILQGLGQTTMGTLSVTGVELTNEIDLYEPPADGKAVGEYHLAQDYRIRFIEA
jgi:hypothetical protein